MSPTPRRAAADTSIFIPTLFVIECATIVCGFIAMLVVFMLR
jgi:hypothetical protein